MICSGAALSTQLNLRVTAIIPAALEKTNCRITPQNQQKNLKVQASRKGRKGKNCDGD